ncbi:hypothetical protein PHYSODRAFT_248550 [Phytophthora sojae]|uniref:C2H2-type domain-containing protein n=1 Tax=Phytophthora sojae (strain P6497) TaxID=1094619 RepID=G5AH99_PHYSP|nr:hypothetical protein PHYSODRAFT_248550 [Phytophthora sojae]EGZ05078.1 hypothetical protein PHYSODRAFT_248550 [Phytophthora sojae]|eukprot:XP_009539450.1 hypothetical protein PHYSODRAFT_248550 [Phytophthora sojae]
MEETPSPPPQAPSAPKDPPVTSMTHAPPPATHKKRPFKVHAEDKTCPKCGKVLQSRLALRVHLNRVYPCDQENVDSTKTCHKCGWKFATPAGLSLHLLKATPCDAPEAPAATRSEERAFKCGKCNEAFTSARSLLAHRSRVYACDGTRTWQGGKTCPKCNKTFCSKQSLRLHLNRVAPCDAEKPSPGTAGGEKKAQTHPAGEKLHGCPGCQRRFATKHGLHVHMSRCPVASQLTKAQSAGAVEFRIAKQGEERSNATRMNVAIHVASVEPFSYSSNVSHGDATSVTDSSSCSSPSTEANGAECGKKDVPLSSTAVGVTSTSEAGNRKRNVDHGVGGTARGKRPLYGWK